MKMESPSLTWLRKSPSRPLREIGATPHEVLAEKPALKEGLLLMVTKLISMSRLLSGSILTCSQSERGSCEELAIQVHSVRIEMTDAMKAIDVSGKVKKGLLRLPLRLDRVAGGLRKIAECSCTRTNYTTFDPKTAAGIDQLFSQTIKVLEVLQDYLRWGEGADPNQCVSLCREIRHQAENLLSGLCEGWQIGFCFTKETHAYWETLHLLMSIATCLEEAALTQLELESGSETSKHFAHGPEAQTSRYQPVGEGHRREPSSRAFENGRIKEENAMTPKKILLCTDFSENSKPAQKVAMTYAEAFGAALVLFHVIDPGVLRYPRFEDLVPMEDTLKSLELACDQELKAMREEIQKVFPAVKAYSVSGAPAQEIVNFAKEKDIDLIVMGTHGWTGLSRLLVGSTAENVVRTAACPVLIVRSFSASS